MSPVSTIVGAPVWDRSWCIHLWLDSIRANLDPADTGLALVCPASDALTREAIADQAGDFAWVEVLRDRNDPQTRESRRNESHATLASARNQLLGLVGRFQPRHYISWDTDLLIPPGGVEMLVAHQRPLMTVWAWLNRQPPKTLRYRVNGKTEPVLYQEPFEATAMRWDDRVPGRAIHYPAHEWDLRAQGTWECDVALAFQLMDRRAYLVSHYAPHPDGEDMAFNWQLERRGVRRYCCGDVIGVHLYDRKATHEAKAGWPDVMKLAEQRPLAASRPEPRSPEYVAFGFWPKDAPKKKETAA